MISDVSNSFGKLSNNAFFPVRVSITRKFFAPVVSGASPSIPGRPYGAGPRLTTGIFTGVAVGGPRATIACASR